ncbi:tryptophan synthase subunit alpha [Seleniivibrio woodruffii]|uniref:tryptophan synthase subunit alpha n=1 Tax=Seleniivibrio woodruffii TaxID=1078050 RepID=UPI0039E405D9
MRGFYIVGGYPDRESFRKCLNALAEAGFEFIEIGIPFSEPVADGPVIASAIHEAVTKGVDIEAIMADVRQMKQKYPSVCATVMTYANIIHGYGEKKFSEDFGDILSGVIIPDLPARMHYWMKEKGLTIPVIPFVTPVSRDEDIEAIKDTDAPFVYYISIMGVTGSDRQGTQNDRAELAKKLTGKTVVTGFGIRTPEDASKAIAATGGFVIGTEVVKRQGNFDEFSKYIADFR